METQRRSGRRQQRERVCVCVHDTVPDLRMDRAGDVRTVCLRALRRTTSLATELPAEAAEAVGCHRASGWWCAVSRSPVA